MIASAWVGLASGPGTAHAFECTRLSGSNRANLVWPTRRVPWVLDRRVLTEAGNQAASELDVIASFDAWNNVNCSDLTFEYEGLVDDPVVGFDESSASNINAVVWVDSGWATEDMDVIAVTSLTVNQRTGVIADVDIELNGQWFAFTRAVGGCRGRTVDIRNTLTHEVGHMLGLDHPPEDDRYRETTMFGSASLCETKKASLARDDEDGICFVYPLGAATRRDCPTSFEEVDEGGGCRDSGPMNSNPWPTLLILALIGWIAHRWARRWSSVG